MNQPAQDFVDTAHGRLYPPRGHWLQGGMLLAVFAAGPGLGWLAGQVLGGVSENAQIGLYFPFPVILFAGYALWAARLKAIAFDGLGRGLLWALARLVIQRKRPERLEDVLPDKDQLTTMAIRAQKAASSFLWGAVPVILLAGLAAVFIDAETGVIQRAAVVTGACLAYAWGLAWLGRRGFLPMLEEGG